MKFSTSLLLAAQALSVLAIPSPNRASTSAAGAATTSASATATATATATPAAGAGAGAEAEEGEENEIEQQAQFGQVIQLGGGNIKTDTLYPPGVNGVFEVEFQNQQGRTMRVSENRNPAAPPTGFTALEPVSYRVEVGGGTRNLTLQKIDYILNANSENNPSRNVNGSSADSL